MNFFFSDTKKTIRKNKKQFLFVKLISNSNLLSAWQKRIVAVINRIMNVGGYCLNLLILSITLKYKLRQLKCKTKMVEATINNSHAFKGLVSAIKELVDKATFHITDEGILLNAMDSSRVSCVDLFVAKTAFSVFKYDQNCALGIHIPSLVKVLKCSKVTDVITLKYNYESDPDVLQLVFSDIS